MSHNQPFKALHDYRYECYRAVVSVVGSLRVLGNRNDGGQLDVGITDWDKESLKMTMEMPMSEC